MVLTLTLLSIVFGAGFGLLGYLFDAYFTARAIAPVASEGHLAMKRMLQELRKANYSSVLLSSAQDNITFLSKHSNEQVTFYPFAPGGSGIFMDQGSLEKKLLARHVKEGSLMFSTEYYGDSALLISIFFVMSDELPDGTEVKWPLFSAVHIEP